MGRFAAIILAILMVHPSPSSQLQLSRIKLERRYHSLSNRQLSAHQAQDAGTQTDIEMTTKDSVSNGSSRNSDSNAEYHPPSTTLQPPMLLESPTPLTLTSNTTSDSPPKTSHNNTWLMDKCDQIDRKMTAKAINFSLSSLFDKTGHIWCNNAETVEVFALDTIHIDADIKPDSGNIKTVILMGHQWHIMGHRVIDLAGIPGRPHLHAKADDGNEKDPIGKDGTPGNPGENGGNFYGYFQALFALGNSTLLINASGGDGGKGQDGGNGKEGIHGVNAQRKDMPSPRGDLSYLHEKRKPFRALIYTSRVYAVHGEPGTLGGNGGHGGLGGYPGHSGTVKFYSLAGDTNKSIQVVANEGHKGPDGKGGVGATGGRNGDDLSCTWSSLLYFIKFFWKCKPQPVSLVAEELYAASGRDGTTGGNSVGVRVPKQSSTLTFANNQIPALQDQYDKFVHGH